jgi:hypothetical protein
MVGRNPKSESSSIESHMRSKVGVS